MPSRVPGAELIEQRIAIQRAIRDQHGNDVARVVGTYIRHIMQSEQRSTLSESEQQVVATLGAISRAIIPQHQPILQGHTAISLLTDVFQTLLEQRSGRNPQPLHFRATTCPDYPHDAATETYLTTGGVGSDVGLCARLLLRGVTPLLSILSTHRVPMVFDFSFADIEGHDPHMLRKSGITQSEFMNRVRDSAQAAQRHGESHFADAGIIVDVRSTLMSSLLASLPRLLGSADIPGSKSDGIMMTRISFYQRFFAEQLRSASDPGEFYRERACKDVLDHVNVGRAIAEEREHGGRTTLVTLSAPALANLFQFGSREHVPVVRLAQHY